MKRKIIGEETVCPKCKDGLHMNIDVGDNHLYDICPGCGFKRKKTLDGQIIEENKIKK